MRWTRRAGKTMIANIAAQRLQRPLQDRGGASGTFAI
jgi:hypothetical protein